jgi:uncharacterized protein DUF6709
MWDGFIGQRIAATTATLRQIGGALLLGALALAAYEGRTLVNIYLGPVHLDEARLARITYPMLELRNYATVEGTNTVSTGVTSIEQETENGTVTSQRTTAEFMVMVTGNHILIVQARPGEKAQKYTGGLASFSGDLRKEIFSVVKDRDDQAATLPIVLDATGSYGKDVIVIFAVAGLLLVPALCLLYQASRRRQMPERHPLCRAISEYGPVESLVPQIDGEIRSAGATFGNATFTPNWVISCTAGTSLAMRREDIIWAYKKRTKRSVNFIPVGSTYASVLLDSRGKRLEISGPEQQVDNNLATWAAQMPWVIFGFDAKLEDLYKRQRDTFVEAVSIRKKAIQSGKTPTSNI